MELAGIRDLEIQLSQGFGFRKDIKGHIECFFEKLRQKLGKFLAFCDDAQAIGAKTVAKQKHAKALRLGAAVFLGHDPTYFSFRAGRK